MAKDYVEQHDKGYWINGTRVIGFGSVCLPGRAVTGKHCGQL
jgi:hypothetical protein